MPSQPACFHRLDEILGALRSMTSTRLDRAAVEKLFRVPQRRARQIMAGLEGLRVGSAPQRCRGRLSSRVWSRRPSCLNSRGRWPTIGRLSAGALRKTSQLQYGKTRSIGRPADGPDAGKFEAAQQLSVRCIPYMDFKTDCHSAIRRQAVEKGSVLDLYRRRSWVGASASTNKVSTGSSTGES